MYVMFLFWSIFLFEAPFVMEIPFLLENAEVFIEKLNGESVILSYAISWEKFSFLVFVFIIKRILQTLFFNFWWTFFKIIKQFLVSLIVLTSNHNKMIFLFLFKTILVGGPLLEINFNSFLDKSLISKRDKPPSFLFPRENCMLAYVLNRYFLTFLKDGKIKMQGWHQQIFLRKQISNH